MKLHGVLDIASLTHVGMQRKNNEDAVDVDVESGIAVLADGMGGHCAGEVASSMAVLSIIADLKHALAEHAKKPTNTQALIPPELHMIEAAVQRANTLVYQVSQNQPRFMGMGTTLVVALFANNQLFLGHIGDSRMYRLRDQTLQRLTEDHSIVQAQINAGLMSALDAKNSHERNLVTRALGIDEKVQPSIQTVDVAVDDVYLLCSDGLTDLVEDAEIEKILYAEAGFADELNLPFVAQKLINSANQQGGKDNISVILIRVKQSFSYKKTWRYYLRELKNAF